MEALVSALVEVAFTVVIMVFAFVYVLRKDS